ncbi:MAG: integron integrase [Pseudomonadota bacterium]
MESKPKFKPNPQLRLMDQVRQVLRYHHYAYRTEQAYCDWIVRYVKFHGATKHPKYMGKREVEAFLSHLATNRNVAVSTQRQALNALIFLYRHVLDKPIDGLIEPVRAKRHRRPPVVMTQSEVQRVLSYIHGTHLLMAQLMYGSGLRLMECVRLRIKDLDFEKSLIYARAAKGGKDRTTIFPVSIQATIRAQVEKVRRLHDEDISRGYGEVYIPEALARKYPAAAKDFRWQYVFPAKKISTDPRTGKVRRHHVLESGLQKAVKTAVYRAGITKWVTCHTFRHSFATHMLENGVNIRVVQELMGHADVKTTEIYTHVMEKDITAVASPLDALQVRT